MPLSPGTKLGQYEILSSLGAGSMGEVYRARDPRLNRDVAIKVLPQFASADPERLYRFEHEAQAAAALSHPNILAVYQMGTFEGTPYLVTELLEGLSLSETLRRGPLPLRKAVEYGIQLAHGLAAAHQRGVIHRDLKPENVFLTKDGHIKILDFGLAKISLPKEPAAALAPTITRIGIAMGTVGYMSPEQVRGLPTDQRTDIFAFGAILYEMVMGKRTFQKATEADTISAILNEEPPPIAQFAPDTPPALERVIRRCLEKNAEQRFHSASDLAFALEALTVPSATAGAVATADSAPRRLNRVWIAAALLLLAGLVASSLILMHPAATPRIGDYVQLTHDGGPKTLIGTDGSRLYLGLGVAASASSSSRGVAQMSTGGGTPQKLAVLPSSDMVPVALSPDGSELLAIDGQGAPPKGPLWSVPILGNSPRKLGDAIAETAAFAPNGKALAFTNLGDLYVSKADGSDARKLLSVKGDIQNITWSPDSLSLRFDSSETVGTVGQQVIWEVSADGTGLHPVLPGWHDPPDECCGEWTPDAKFFVFQSQGQIWSLAQKSFWRSHPQPAALTSSPMTLSSPLPSKDGKKLFLIGQTYRGELMKYDSKSHQFTPFLGGISAEFVDFSKDGQWITYVSYREGTLWRSRVDGSDRLQLTYPPMYPLLPRWSPDGKTILFFEFALGDKPARMYEISPEGGSPRLVLPDDHSQQLDPNWSPDGSKIIFANESNDPSSAIHILDRATHKITDLPGSHGLYSPRWSPDSHYVSAFSGDSKTLLLFDFKTQNWTPLASGSLSWLNWSHDSQYVYLLDFRGKNAVVRIRVADKRVEQVADVKDLNSTGRYGTALALTPDDSPLVLHDTGTQDVYSVDWKPQ